MMHEFWSGGNVRKELGVEVWGAISYSSKGPLVGMHGNITSKSPLTSGIPILTDNTRGNFPTK